MALTVLECVLNLSEGRRPELVSSIAASAGACLLDVHRDPWHNRSVLTLAGPDTEGAARAVATSAFAQLDLRDHTGVHPRLGVVDVVPFVPLKRGRAVDGLDLAPALAARDDFARWAGACGVPAFCYGPERPLPELRREARDGLEPAAGPGVADPRRGSVCVGARAPLVAYNLFLAEPSIELARAIARRLRSSMVRALGFPVGDEVQVSCNLIDPFRFGPGACYDAVAHEASVARAELVGLVPDAVLRAEPRHRWDELGLGEGASFEGRLQASA